MNFVHARRFEFQTTLYLFLEGRLKAQNARYPMPLPRAWLAPHTLRSEFPSAGCVNLVHARRFGFQTTLYLFLEGRLKVQNACHPTPLPRAWFAPHTLVYRNSRIIATNRPAAIRTHPRQTTVE